jgi:hypothetical protein
LLLENGHVPLGSHTLFEEEEFSQLHPCPILPHIEDLHHFLLRSPMFLPSPHSSPDQTSIQASHEPLAKVHHILLPPSYTTYNYQKVSPFVAYRKNINTSSMTYHEYSNPRNLNGAINLNIQNPSKSQAFLVPS